MAESADIDFWLSMGSTYTYLAVMRVPSVQQETGVTFRWRPFNLGVLLREMNHTPFADKPAKAAYMWRDIERRAGKYGIPVQVPVPYPAKNPLLANRVAIVGMQEGWGERFIQAAYRRWFQLGQETGSDPNLTESLREAGQDPQRVLERAQSDETAQMLETETNQARELGIFGGPNFVVGRELFWGDDRLEDAVSWLRHSRVV
jgi:2-hydroxychromene-2-carboxylate isomerase